MPWLLGGAVLALFLLLMVLQSSNLWRNLAIESSGDLVLLYALSSLNFLAFIIFGFIFARSIVRLVVERRTLQLGSKIKTRLLIYFFAISILPIIAMALFSFLFMNRALERWFTQIPAEVIRETTKLQKRTLGERVAMLEEATKMLAATISPGDVNAERLTQIARAGGLAYIAVESAGRTVSGGFAESISEQQRREIERLIVSAEASDGRGFDVATAPMGDGGRLIVASARFAETSPTAAGDSPMVEFEALKEREVTIRQVGLLTLGVLTFLLIFASMWIAFYTARGLTNPIRALAEGAAEIGNGNLNHRVRVMATDELALLVTAFNEMSATLEENSEELTARRRYIETILETLPAGVLSIDAHNRISTINTAAKSIFRLEDADFSGIELDAIVESENGAVLNRVMGRARRVGFASEHAALRRERGDGDSRADAPISVALTASALPDGGGAVLVIEDLSELMAAQRASAWQEVARRMAHEIKNPLTPIQLSAERIAKRFAEAPQVAVTGAFAPDANAHTSQDQLQSVIDESTATILREVHSLKTMVDEFSRFAKLPDAKLETGNLNDVVTQAVEVFDDRFHDVRIETELGTGIPDTQVDREQLKRVFVNLIENSVEAFADDAVEKIVSISTRHDTARDLLIAQVSDTGKGIDPASLQRLFQPYFSTKGRGTGLGLAIVRRIVTEHGGRIFGVANASQGAKFIIELPVS